MKEKMEIRERMEIPLISIGSRFDPTPKDYVVYIHERFCGDVVVETIHRKRIYSGIVGDATIVIDDY